MLVVKVAGGTNAGHKRPLAPSHGADWTCGRGHDNPAYATICLTSGCRDKRV